LLLVEGNFCEEHKVSRAVRSWKILV